METLAEQRRVLKGIDAIVSRLKEEMDASILATHPAEESAVSSYFLLCPCPGCSETGD